MQKLIKWWTKLIGLSFFLFLLGFIFNFENYFNGQLFGDKVTNDIGLVLLLVSWLFYEITFAKKKWLALYYIGVTLSLIALLLINGIWGLIFGVINVAMLIGLVLMGQNVYKAYFKSNIVVWFTPRKEQSINGNA